MSNTATALYKALHKKRAYTKLYWDIANAIGIYEALLIEIVERWCELNEERGKLNYFQQGEWWTSATYLEWAEMYPKLGTWKSIQKMFLALEKQGYILSNKFTKGSQAKYYRVNPESIGKLLLSGTLKTETGIVSKSDGTVSECDYAISKSDYAISKSDGTVSECDDPYIEDQIIQKDHSNTPLTPQGGEEKHVPALGDFGSEEPMPPALEREVVVETVSQVSQPEFLDVISSSESKEAITARDNKTINLQNSGYRMEQQIRSRTNYKFPSYRTGMGWNGIKQEFVEWLCSSYLPAVFREKDKKVELIDAKRWVNNKEKNGCQEEVEGRYEQMLSRQQGATPAQSTAPQLTPEQEAWVAIAKEIEMVSDAYVVVSHHRELWQVTSNFGDMNGTLDAVMQRVPLAKLPIKFKIWYSDCYRRAKQKNPHLPLPAPIEPQEMAS